jgi:hypothetical protein
MCWVVGLEILLKQWNFGVGVASETVREYKDRCLKRTIDSQRHLSSPLP